MQGIVYAVTFSVIFVLGICHMQNAIKSHQAVESLLEDGEKAAVWGTVSKKEEGAKSTKIYLKHCYLRVEEKQLPCRQILVYLNTDVSVGNIIYVNGTVKTLEPARNEGNFDEKNFYESQGTDFKFYGENVQFISRDTDRFAEFLYQKKREVIQLYQKTMGAETAGVLSTMVLGDRQLLEPEIKSLYQKTGISHILAISGVKTLKLDIPLVPETRIKWAFVPLHIAIIYILKLCLDEEIIPRCRFPCSRGYHKKHINWQKKQ